MGISKARGMAWAKRYQKRGGRVFVMTGDGELQEGQIWESLQTSVHLNADITVIIDHNKLQTDLPLQDVIGLGDLEEKIKSFGCEVARCYGHDFAALAAVFQRLGNIHGKPKVLIADTIKGRGVSFMENVAQQCGPQGKYVWHSGAPSDETFELGFQELLNRIQARLAALRIPLIATEYVPQEPAAPKTAVTREYVAAAFGEELLSLAAKHPHIVVLDGDLSADCKVRGFELTYRDRFIENGIAEQDMVSSAGGLALQGMLPVCNSFSSFLCARANEQIYNNSCEGTKIIYAAHFAGVIPAGPGKSHQSVRDIGLLGSLPQLVILQPCNSEEARMATRWAVEDTPSSVCLRMNIGPSPREIKLPAGYHLTHGRGCLLRNGTDAILFSYGAVMLHEALGAAEIAAEFGVSVAVAAHPWLNRFDLDWLSAVVKPFPEIYTLDDHVIDGGMGQRMLAALAQEGVLGDRRVQMFGLRALPACGTPFEVLQHHGLDAKSLANEILRRHGRAQTASSANTTMFYTLEAAQ
jgi:transketolase